MKWPPGQGLTEYQDEVLTALHTQRRVAVRGPHGLGKTALSSVAVLWFALTRNAAAIDWKIPMTASAWRQLSHYLLPEIHKWARRINWDAVGFRGPFNMRTELLGYNVHLSNGEAFALACSDSTTIEGAHATQLMYLFDESKTIPPATWDSAEGAFSTGECWWLAVSTPGEPNGRFYDIHARKPGYEDWWARHVTVEECIAAGRVSGDWIEQRRVQWGEQTAVFQNRVLGEFASSDTDGVIPLAWIELANERWAAWDAEGRGGNLKRLGVDVGATGNETVFAPLYDTGLMEVIGDLRYLPKDEPEIATMATCGRIMAVLDANPATEAVVDIVGMGAGIVGRLTELEAAVVGFNAGEGTDLMDRSGEIHFANKRAAGWWLLREALDPTAPNALALPPDDTLIGDLTAPRYFFQSGGRLCIESKADIKKRIGRSTDAGDSVVHALWENPVYELSFM